MSKLNHLDEVPLAELTPHQLEILQEAESNVSKQDEQEQVYLIAFRKPKSGS